MEIDMNISIEHTRIRKLESSLRVSRTVSLCAMSLVVIFLMTGFSSNMPFNKQSTSIQDVVRSRAVIIVDENGNDRIVLGSPIPNPKEGIRQQKMTGIVINDESGFERFGVGLGDNEFLGMGFDAPPGAGEKGNRERCNVIVYPTGDVELRMLDNLTRVKVRLVSEAENNAYLQYIDWSGEKPAPVNLNLSDLRKIKQIGE